MNNGRERSESLGPSGSSGRFERLEGRLSRVRPAALPPELFDRIAGRLEQVEAPRRSGDRPLWCAIGAGLAAACTILVLLTSDLAAPPPAPAPVAAQLAANRPPCFGDYPQFIARADAGGWDGK